MSEIHVGSTPILRGKFYAITFANDLPVYTLTDPTTVSLFVRPPHGPVQAYTLAGGTVAKESTGIYTAAVSITHSGVWNYRWESTGTVKSASEFSFEVVGQKVVPPTP
jgi:hypothetical protein